MNAVSRLCQLLSVFFVDYFELRNLFLVTFFQL